MKKHMEQIAAFLKKQEPVIIYTVGSGTFECIRELKQVYGVLPTAVCDGDIKKQGHSYRGLEGLTVISPEAALREYPKGKFYIASLDCKYQIIGFLAETCGVAPERIINYEPVRKIRSCSFLQKALIYDRGRMQFCWRNPCPGVPEQEKLDTKALYELRNQLLDEIQNNKVTCYEACNNCPQIWEEYYPETPCSWSVNYFCQSRCNYKCAYCTLAEADALEENVGRHLLGMVIQSCKENGLLAEDYSVILSTAGEPTLHPKRKEFYEAFDGAELVVNTNGSIFDVDLFETLQNKRTLIVCSIDAGTPETYEKIKGAPFYEKVKKNIEKYTEALMGIVALKYLVVPGVNDKLEDIEGFVRFVEETGAIFVIISVDYYSVNRVTEHTKTMINKMRKLLEKKEILCVPYTTWETVEYSRMMKELFA